AEGFLGNLLLVGWHSHRQNQHRRHAKSHRCMQCLRGIYLESQRENGEETVNKYHCPGHKHGRVGLNIAPPAYAVELKKRRRQSLPRSHVKVEPSNPAPPAYSTKTSVSVLPCRTSSSGPSTATWPLLMSATWSHKPSTSSMT